MEAILKAAMREDIPCNPAVVISNRPGVRGLRVAERLGIATRVIESRNFAGSRWDYDNKIADELARNKVTPRNGLVCLAGFMRILSTEFVARYKNKIINIHPSLLPAFPGLDAQRQALDYGVGYSGCTVHFVDSGVDTGPIIMQQAVRVRSDDTEETLSKRILAKEHTIYPMVVKLFALQKIRVCRKKVVIDWDA